MGQTTRDTVRVVWRWRFLIIAIFLVTTVAAAVFSSYYFKPVYRVIARVDPGALAWGANRRKGKRITARPGWFSWPGLPAWWETLWPSWTWRRPRYP